MKDNDIFAEDKKKLNKNMLVYGAFNGVCVVGALRQCAHMVKDGYDNGFMFMLLMYLACAGVSARKIYKMHQYKKELTDNQNQRQWLITWENHRFDDFTDILFLAYSLFAEQLFHP